MELKISPALQAKIERIAAQQGRDSESLVQEALERLVDYDEWFLREVEKGLAQVQSGQVIDHSEISSRMENLITEKQRRG
jgi:predicted transcriptional regulator